MTLAAASGSDATHTAEVRDRVREAVARREPLRILGGGTWLDANRPVVATTRLSTNALTGIVEYVPGDLTLTARAGTTLDEIAQATAEHDQWLALDPVGDPRRATIGATIATASYGPLAHHFGRPRDMTLGLEFVTGNADVARGGGRVVKNVAGFDLTRLLTGSWGSLGVITEVSVRLRARPAVQCTLAIDVAAGRDDVDLLYRRLRELPFSPFAVQLLDQTLARAVGARENGAVVVVRLGGNEEAVRAQRAQMRSFGEPRDHVASLWDRLRLADPATAVVLRLSQRPSRFADSWRDAALLTDRWPGAFRHGDPGLGVVRCIFPYDDADSRDSLRRLLDESPSRTSTRVFERLPEGLWPVCAPGRATERLHAGVKRAFDPHRVLNPGILGDVE